MRFLRKSMTWSAPPVAQTGIVPLPRRREQILGGHAVVVVGYDDSQSRFIVRNSWGTAWGLAGYFLMPYAYLTNPRLADDFWTADRAA
jgi:C1A family cysteine protease